MRTSRFTSDDSGVAFCNENTKNNYAFVATTSRIATAPCHDQTQWEFTALSPSDRTLARRSHLS